MITAYIDEAFLVQNPEKSYAKVVGRVRADSKKRAPDGYEICAHVDRPFEISEKSIIIETPSGSRYKMENFDNAFLHDAIKWNERCDKQAPDLEQTETE